MSRQELKESFQGLLYLILIAGILIVIGSIITLMILTWLYPSSLGNNILEMFPLLVVGFVIIGLSAKLLEILN